MAGYIDPENPETLKVLVRVLGLSGSQYPTIHAIGPMLFDTIRTTTRMPAGGAGISR
jgi:hypothetical protein